MKCEGWQRKKLEELATFSQGKQISVEEQYFDFSKGRIRFLRIVDYSTPQEAPRYVFDLGEKYHVDPKDLVMVRYGSQSAGKVVRGYSGLIANNLFKINIDEQQVDKDFGYYYLSSSYVQQLMMNTQSSSTMPAITFGMLNQIFFPLPSLPEQKAIAAVLSALDDKIELNNRINQKLEEMAQAIFKSWFVDFEPFQDGEFVESELGMIPKGWRVGTLLDIADYLNGLAMQKYRPEEGEEGIPVLKIKELRQGICDLSSEECSPHIKAEYIINDGDVVFSWSGSLLVDFWCGGVCGLNQHLFKVTSAKYYKWFYYMWTNYHLQRFVEIAKNKAPPWDISNVRN